MANTDIQTITKSETKVSFPGEYYVVMHDDDKTTFDFVIAVLTGIFGHDPQTAVDLTQKIHNDGDAIVGMYNKEIAEQKVAETTALADANGFPLRATIDPA